MKLLLTSSGLNNKSIRDALSEMVGKHPMDTSIVVIPTAMNVEIGNKEWFIDNLVDLKNEHFKQIEIADISAIGEEFWLPKLEEADVLFFGGGNNYHLMECINKSGLAKHLPKLLKTKIWVGVSAGSMITNEKLPITFLHLLYSEDLNKAEDLKTLNYTDFYFLPHLNSTYFTKVRKENLKNILTNITKKVYVVDDNTAIKVVHGSIEIISEGEYLEFN